MTLNSSQDTTVMPTPTSGIPNSWRGRVEVTVNESAMACENTCAFINAMPHLKTVTMEEAVTIIETAADLGLLAFISVVHSYGHISIEPMGPDQECYHAYVGTHTRYGNFAVLLSVRGPGDEQRPRACYLVHDNEAVFM